MSLEFDLAGSPPDGPERAVRRQLLFLPTWTPGSYLIREYARHLSRVVAVDAATGLGIPCRKVSKNRFELSAGTSTSRVRVAYRVYAHELSVRTADLTAAHAYWNHACVLLWPVGETNRAAHLRIDYPTEWRLACSLRQVGSSTTSQSANTQTTTLVARDLDAVMDAPCLVGTFQRLEWMVDAVPHTIVLDGLAGVPIPSTLGADLTSLALAAKDVFGGSLPYPAYTFICLFAGEGHGGLEHGESTTLLASRTTWTTTKGYREFLGLAAHELFHAWNVKRMRPAEFWTYDYEHENYTELLWLIEGWTAYYDDLLCQRAGLLTREDYLGILAKSVNSVLSGPGRKQLSLGESSFDAWIRLYRPDENTRNSSQNYYVNGSVAALCLDLLLRRESQGACSLDTVIRTLYETTFGSGRAYTIGDVRGCIERLAGTAAADALTALVDQDLDPDLHDALASVGVNVIIKDAERPYLGVNFESGGTRVATVISGSPAHTADLAPGDELLAIQGLRVDSARWQEVFEATARVGMPLELLLSRRGVITQATAIPGLNPGTVVLELAASPDARQKERLDAWLAPNTARQVGR